MLRLFRWVIGIPIFVLVVAFAVANRHWVNVSLDPIHEDAPRMALGMPLWLLLFLGLFMGVVMGWIACWWAQGRWRKLARERQREIARLQNEMSLLRDGPQKVEPHMLAPLPGIMP